MNEDYVSFETAKLLKKKGFDEKCPCSYRKKLVDSKIVDEEELFVSAHLMLTNSELEDKSYRDIVYCSAPTLQMAMKWIRKKYNAYPVPYALSLGWAFDIFDLTKTDITGSKKIYSMDAPLKSDCFDSYENAAEAAINYYLDNFA